MASWLIEGTAHRSPVRIHPVRHLLVDSGRGAWAMWCSSSKGRPDHNPQSRKFCRACKTLAADAIAAGDLGIADLAGWPLTQPISRATARPGDATGVLWAKTDYTTCFAVIDADTTGGYDKPADGVFMTTAALTGVGGCGCDAHAENPAPGSAPVRPAAFTHFPPQSGMDDRSAEDNGLIG